MLAPLELKIDLKPNDMSDSSENDGDLNLTISNTESAINHNV